jgi:hypothetical protein
MALPSQYFIRRFLVTNLQLLLPAGKHSIIEPSTALHSLAEPKVKIRVTLRLAVYRPSVYLGVKPLETHDQNFPPPQLNFWGNSPYVSSLLHDGFVSYEYAWPFVKCTFRTYNMLLNNTSFSTTHKSCASCVTSSCTCLPSRSIATAVWVKYRDNSSIVCGH